MLYLEWRTKTMSQPQTSKEYFSSLSIIHTALLMAQVVAMVVAFFLNSNNAITKTEGLDSVFQFIVPLIVIAGILGSNFVSKSQLKSIKQRAGLKEKLDGYRTTLLVKLALLEMPVLFAIVCFLLTGSYFILSLAGLIIVIFFINRPSKESLTLDLELSASDKKAME